LTFARAAIALLVSLAGACTFAIGADEPERRQSGEPCGEPRDCADGLLCIVGKCGPQSATGGPCEEASDCADASSICSFCACTPCSGAACASFALCGHGCSEKCALRQPCGVDADCDPKAALVCDVEHHECVIPDCRVAGGDFVCGPPQCADWCTEVECASQCTTGKCTMDLANGRTCDATAGSTCLCTP
jgi:hypothetical protein